MNNKKISDTDTLNWQLEINSIIDVPSDFEHSIHQNNKILLAQHCINANSMGKWKKITYDIWTYHIFAGVHIQETSKLFYECIILKYHNISSDSEKHFLGSS